MGKIDWIEGIGFMIEINLFVGAGLFIKTKPLLALVYYIVGLLMAYTVGKRIQSNAIKKYKEEMRRDG